MQAAAHGKSTLGIPKSVGKEFAAADMAKSAKNKAMKKSSSKGKSRR